MAEPVWHKLETYALCGKRLQAVFFIPDQSAWFAGHFPDDPVLPGVSMLGMVKELLLTADPSICITGLKRVRFRQLVHGNASLEISIMPAKGENGHLLSFDIFESNNLISSGLLETDRPLQFEGIL